MSELERKRRALAIFDAVVELDDAKRAQALDTMCAGDADLRARVQALLDADAHATEPFDGDAAAWGSALAGEQADADAALGRAIGAWKIVGTIGRGGMGAVHAVERSDGAYTQQAALKLIRASADSPVARERFLRERGPTDAPRVHVLLDESRGKGLAPASWSIPTQYAGLPVYVGFAGGIGPANTQDVLNQVRALMRPYWIDMETSVRTDNAFDVAKVEAVLRAAEPFVAR